MKQPRIEDLFDRHFDEVHGYIAFRVSPDFESAQDLSQAVFEAALRGIEELRKPDSARSWLMQIARNKVADYYRGKASENGFIPVNSEAFDQWLASAPAPEDREQRNRAMLTTLVMRKLSGHHTSVLEDKYIRGLSVRDIARETDTTEKAVESALTRARNAFRQTYAELETRDEACHE